MIPSLTASNTVIPVSDFTQVDQHLTKYDIKILYLIKYGYQDGLLSHVAKNIVHCVFQCRQPHGDIYCSISSYVDGNTDGQFPVLPHIVYLPGHDKNMRNNLNIPTNAIVYGRHGGAEQFDIKYVQDIVYQVAKTYPNIYFVFVNTNRFCPSLNNIIHLGQIIDPVTKREFINTCDAMIWGRQEGETFGLAIAEFSFCNKPVIATKTGDQAHVHYLGQSGGYWYHDQNSLSQILTTFDPQKDKDRQWNCYQQFNPQQVINTLAHMINHM